jgi:ubiquinone/menaquinone biosynthesis C-methylase UbiE
MSRQEKPAPHAASPYLDADLAAAYDKLAVPHHFDAPAEDLVSLAGLTPGATVLDLGAGTGAVTAHARRRLGPAGRVVALDPSPSMLGVLRGKCACRTVVGLAPGLPFTEGAFDAVLANFVLSHLRDREAGLADVVRVLRPGGRLGMSAWGARQSEPARLWSDVAEQYCSREHLARAFQEIIPWDEWFTDEAHLRQAFEAAGLAQVVVLHREYRIRIGVEEFLAIREASVEGKLLQGSLDGDAWQEFRRRLLVAFRTRFPPRLEYLRPVHLAFGTKA